MNKFSDVITQTIALLQPLSPQLQALPPEIAQISRAEQQGELCLKNQFLKVAGIGELRSASVSSAKIEIANFLFFPEIKTYTPVYAAEFVSLSELQRFASFKLSRCSATQSQFWRRVDRQLFEKLFVWLAKTQSKNPDPERLK